MKIANAQNNSFASSYSQTDTSACKRAVFLLSLPNQPTTLDNSLTRIKINKKSYGLKSFLGNLNFWILNDEKNHKKQFQFE